MENSEHQLSYPFSFITGPAGSGKTYTIIKECEANPKAALLCATTGAASVNLGSTTIHSTLKFYDYDSLMTAHNSGRVIALLKDIHQDYDAVCVDECSMLGANLSDLLISIWEGYNANLKSDSRAPLGLIFTGDFAQLPPVRDKWAFQGVNWQYLQPENVRKLTKIWRQSDPLFLEGLALARAGQGALAVRKLKEAGVQFGQPLLSTYEGTTIFPTLAEVKQENLTQVAKCPGAEIRRPYKFEGRIKSEWQKNMDTQFYGRLGCRVTIRRNQLPDFSYVNGDSGVLLEWPENGNPLVRLDRTGEEVRVLKVTDYWDVPSAKAQEMDAKQRQQGGTTYYYIGAVTWWPLTLGYATTCHSSQGQTLDRVRISFRHRFFQSPNMAYVALSRCRTPQGLTIVGTPDVVAKAIRLDPVCKQWI